MKEQTRDLSYDVAATLWRGRRPYQEDSIEHRFSDLADFGYVVLADGMGGHNAGDVASLLAVQSVSNHLQLDIETHDGFCTDIGGLLSSAVDAANAAIAEVARTDKSTAGMGTTLVTALLCANRLYWTSVGDSPLYLWRDKTLRLLNEDHSLAPVIDQMVASGELTPEAARNHPDRHALTSAITGDSVSKIDLRPEGMVLQPGDVVLVASDGLQYIEERSIAAVLANAQDHSSEEICDALIGELQALDHPHQDNVSICVLRVASDEEGQAISAQRIAASSSTRPLDLRPKSMSRRWLAPSRERKRSFFG